MIPAITREQLRETLEHSVSNVEQVDGRFRQISGMRIAWDPTTPVGSRIISATLDSGEELIADGAVQPGAGITAATVDFTAAGGDGFTTLGSLPFHRSSVFAQAALRDYIVTPVADGGLGGSITAARYPEVPSPGDGVRIVRVPDTTPGAGPSSNGDIPAERTETTGGAVAELNSPFAVVSRGSGTTGAVTTKYATVKAPSAARSAAPSGTGRRVRALRIPAASLSRSNSWRCPSRFTTTRRAASIRSYVVKRAPQATHSRRRRMVAASSRSRESMTRVSRSSHVGQRIRTSGAMAPQHLVVPRDDTTTYGVPRGHFPDQRARGRLLNQRAASRCPERRSTPSVEIASRAWRKLR